MRTDIAIIGPVPRVLAAGVAGGLVDAVYASTRGLVDAGSASLPWRAVASGWLGGSAYQGGASAVALGLATHFAIASIMAAVWMWGLSRLSVTRTRPVSSAIVYGLALYAVMYLVVLPLRWPSVFPRWDGTGSVLDIVAHVAMALVISRFTPPARPATSRPVGVVVS